MRPTWGSSPGGYPISPSSSATGPDSVSCTAVPTALALALGCPTSGRGLTSPPPRNADQVSADHTHGTFRRRTADRARTAAICVSATGCSHALRGRRRLAAPQCRASCAGPSTTAGCLCRPDVAASWARGPPLHVLCDLLDVPALRP